MCSNVLIAAYEKGVSFKGFSFFKSENLRTKLKALQWFYNVSKTCENFAWSIKDVVNLSAVTIL